MQNLTRGILQRAKQKMKDYYNQRAKETVFEVVKRVWVYTPRTRKGLFRKLMHNRLGPYRVVEKLSPVNFKLRTIKVAFTCHANRMKPFVGPNLRPIDPPPFDDPAEPHLGESDIPKDCFEPNSSSEANPKGIGLSPTCNVAPTISPRERKKRGIGFLRWIDNQIFLAINLRSRALRVRVELC